MSNMKKLLVHLYKHPELHFVITEAGFDDYVAFGRIDEAEKEPLYYDRIEVVNTPWRKGSAYHELFVVDTNSTVWRVVRDFETPSYTAIEPIGCVSTYKTERAAHKEARRIIGAE